MRLLSNTTTAKLSPGWWGMARPSYISPSKARMTKRIALVVSKHTTSGTSPLKGISQQLPLDIITLTQFAPRCGSLKVCYK